MNDFILQWVSTYSLIETGVMVCMVLWLIVLVMYYRIFPNDIPINDLRKMIEADMEREARTGKEGL